jgi:SAM-dependent methyltransferase
VNRTVTRQNASWERRLIEQHFATVAPQYRSLRETDDDAIQLIRARLPNRPVIGVDVGAGSGRYTELLQRTLPDGAMLLAADLSHAMLVTSAREVAGHTPALRCESERLPLACSSLDFVTTFNAVHHFGLDDFVEEVQRVLRPDGQLFVYTRTPEQNARSIWGQEFPGFLAHETRLYDEATLVSALGGLGAVQTTSFAFPRRATAARLAERVRGGAYSTFRLYDPRELDNALAHFLKRVDGHEVHWQDHNLLVHVQRQR